MLCALENIVSVADSSLDAVLISPAVTSSTVAPDATIDAYASALRVGIRFSSGRGSMTASRVESRYACQRRR